MEKFINPDKSTWNSLTKRASVSYDSLEPLAKVIFKEVEKDGDHAISYYTLKFDKVQLKSNVVSPDEISAATERVPEKLKLAIQKYIPAFGGGKSHKHKSRKRKSRKRNSRKRKSRKRKSRGHKSKRRNR